ncbi:tRNA threonylcarbamoyladenosine biosynthesis protein TsaB [Dysgonomonas sp. PFB1-18]|uniref:tRNA (adenosine(37)-N6)-threonylcarbamoyltransferase complex dimerization subunit type 1 TsaB n=1 Tax=unclassified Dysgonomonas TaxID=2630389 RepID=UPI002476E59D|nr:MULTISPECIES: tRNA (adenosine(37)-N6)-threonylcarbamoyltransferase complex dimerization subunit type 1 TsaB [unclassified Dysgonomonas]MDH6310742.1 tRNA threonylcarbamoyladenosine biosynthesis protein TsaB [Dysgonomonas sp. PF1-14]MDH6340592.1 tRNA threonylcarbamoyladenosine biosynthesis protein TsaB [Dysgonomonas sp. PF1-16]MDH6382151.1 tRNA threonylcarbamoyladenosine biosynthesis protein TsaB [Dysgonomonas sp. PFB1-18]MDH6399495.1 tRNA threonylcarbamoyladenosine biosynthesis protein TsaB [
MSCIINIETATEVCSVAVSKDKEIIFLREEEKGPSHAVLLGQFVNEAIQYLRSANISLDAVAVSCGPGSYTGLRIGVSEAKGLCFGLDIPLISLNTLKIMTYGVRKNNNPEDGTLLCPMIDARRMEVYDVLYNNELQEIKSVSADIIEEGSFSEYLNEGKVLFFGNGADKCKAVLNHPNALFIDNIHPHASYMADLADEAYRNRSFVDVAYFEPFYLKEFVATTPKNKVLPLTGK